MRGVLAPAHRDGLALVLSSGLTSVIGVLYWVLAARLVPPAVLGLDQVAVSTMMFLGGLAQLNLGYALLRFVPVAGRATRRIVAGGYAAATLSSVLIGAVFAVGAPLWAPRMVEAFGPTRVLVFFVIAVPVWTIFTVQDSVLTGIGYASAVPVENLVFAMLKIGLLAVATVGVVLPGRVAVSWAAATGAAVLAVSLWLFLRGLPAHARTTAGIGGPAAPTSFRAVVRFVRADYAGGILWQAAQFGLPLLVLGALGTEQAAVYGIAWMMAQALYLVAAGMGQSMVAHTAADVEATDVARRQMVRRTLALVVPAAAVLALGTPWILILFGPRYAADGGPVLVLTALSAIPNVVTAAAVASARVRQRVVVQFGVPSTIAATVIVLTWMLLPRLGITAVGVAWLAAQSAVAAAILLTGAAWLPPGIARPVSALRTTALLRRVRAVAEDRTGRGPCVLGDRLSGGSGTVVIGFGPSAEDTRRTLLKASDTLQGRAQLLHQTEVLRRLHNDRRLGDWDVLVPRVIGDGEAHGAYAVLETRLTGVGGAAALNDPARCETFRESAVAAITDLHRRTATPVIVGPDEVDAWVREPMAAVVAALPHRAGPTAWALADLLAAQLLDHGVLTAWTHGDYTPDNVLTDEHGHVNGIVDWGQSAPDGLAVVDVITFLLTAQRSMTGDELGAVVLRRLTETPAAEKHLLVRTQREAGMPALDTVTLTLLGWLHHAAQNLQKSPVFAANPIWVRRNLLAVIRGADAILLGRPGTGPPRGLAGP